MTWPAVHNDGSGSSQVQDSSPELVPIAAWKHVDLGGGLYTAFALFRYRDRNKIVGFPEYNYNLALNEGTEEVQTMLREIRDAYEGVDLKKEIELAARLTTIGRVTVRNIARTRRLHRRLVKIANMIRNIGR